LVLRTDPTNISILRELLINLLHFHTQSSISNTRQFDPRAIAEPSQSKRSIHAALSTMASHAPPTLLRTSLRALHRTRIQSTTTTPTTTTALCPAPLTRPRAIYPLSTSTARTYASRAPLRRDRGPPSSETTQTDFGRLDIFGSAREPSVAISECAADGFRLGDGRRVHGAGVLCVGGEAFWWRPGGAAMPAATAGTTTTTTTGMAGLRDAKGRLRLDERALAVLGVVWPKPGRFSFFLLRFPLAAPL
jgi:hypothetical protein